MRLIAADPAEATLLDVDLDPAIQAAENARRLLTLLSDRCAVAVVGHFLLLFAGHHAIRGLSDSRPLSGRDDGRHPTIG